MNIILVGLSRACKTSCAKKMTEMANLQFIDCDRIFEVQNGDIKKYYLKGRLNYYHNEERELLERLNGLDGLIIATGRGVLLDERYVRLLKGLGEIVYIESEPESAGKKDVEAGFVPDSFDQSEYLSTISNFAKSCTKSYEQNCNLKINMDKLTAQEAAEAIASNFNIVLEG